MTPDRPDSELIAGSRAEPSMFAGIFDRHHAELYRYLRRSRPVLGSGASG